MNDEWCLEWKETHRKASVWDRFRHFIADLVGADEFYTGVGYECDDDIRDIFRSEWIERECVERNPDYQGISLAYTRLADFMPRLSLPDTPLLSMMTPADPPVGEMMHWNWGTMEPADPIVSEPPSDGQQPSPASALMSPPDLPSGSSQP